MTDQAEPVDFLSALQESRDTETRRVQAAERERKWLNDNEALGFFRLSEPLDHGYVRAIEQFTEAGFRLPKTSIWVTEHPNTHVPVAFADECLADPNPIGYFTDKQREAKWKELTGRVYPLWDRNHKRCHLLAVSHQVNSEDTATCHLVYDKDGHEVLEAVGPRSRDRGTPSTAELVAWLVKLANEQSPRISP